MQFLRVPIYAHQLLDQHARIMEVEWYEAGVLKISDDGECTMALYAMPNIKYHIPHPNEKLPVIR